MHKLVDQLEWMPHPRFEGVLCKPLLTEKDDGATITLMLVRTPKGVTIPIHVHPDSDDIIFPLEGKGKIFIKGLGVQVLEPGVWVRVPKNTEHNVFDVEETLVVYDVFVPAIL